MDIPQLILVGLIMFAASTVQSAVGFAFTLFALPFLLLVGLTLPEAVAVTILSSAIQRIIAVSYLRHAVDWQLIKPMIFYGVAMLPVGTLVLREVTFLSPHTAKQIIGVVILLTLLSQWFGNLKPRESVHCSWGYLAGAVSGFLTGFANIGGPPIVLWILAHRWSNERMRIMASIFTLSFVPFQLIILPIVFGKPVLTAYVSAIPVSPMVVAGSWCGLKVGSRIHGKHLRLTMQIILLVIALVSLLKPLLGSPGENVPGAF